jgi:hypothetical protein
MIFSVALVKLHHDLESQTPTQRMGIENKEKNKWTGILKILTEVQ